MGIWVIHTGPKSGGEQVMLFGGYSYDGVSSGIWVIHTGPRFGTSMYDPYTRTHTIIRVTAKKRHLLPPDLGPVCMTHIPSPSPSSSLSPSASASSSFSLLGSKCPSS